MLSPRWGVFLSRLLAYIILMLTVGMGFWLFAFLRDLY